MHLPYNLIKDIIGGYYTVIEINNLSFSYENKKPYLLENITLKIPAGAFVSVVGENGSCKTTLVKIILGLLTPSEGKVKKISANIGYVPQRFDNFNSSFPLTVKEVLDLHMKTLKIKNSTAIDEVLDKVGMSKFKNKLIGGLSGGQLQKIFIARSLLGNPSILVLDELTNGVDEKSQKEIFSLIKELNNKYNITILSVEHNLKRAKEVSSHLLTVANKKVTLSPNIN